MLANLITTILLALGVATGNVSSNVYKGGNAFNNEIELNNTKPIQNAINTDVTLRFESVQSYNINNNPNKFSRKYYMYEEGQTTTSPVYNNEYFNIYNSTYMYPTDQSNQTHYKLITIFKLTPYVNYTQETITIKQNIVITNTNGGSTYWIIYTDNFISNTDISDKIDMNLTIGTLQDLDTNIVNNNSIKTYRETNTNNLDTNSPDLNLLNNENDYIINNIIDTETYYIVLITTVVQGYPITTANLGYIEPNSINIKGQGRITEINYEVVDIPNLMFTILTMPFSWYSTAFNLTVFPGTPYALNFGNLILTMVAALTLLYIIKKILK